MGHEKLICVRHLHHRSRVVIAVLETINVRLDEESVKQNVLIHLTFVKLARLYTDFQFISDEVASLLDFTLAGRIRYIFCRYHMYMYHHRI